MATNAVPPAPIDIDLMLRCVRELQAMADPEPIADWMRGLGFDPNDGYVLVLPSCMGHIAGQFRPRYVWLSSLVLEPCIMLNPAHWPNLWPNL